jgi:hypothetical protein
MTEKIVTIKFLMLISTSAVLWGWGNKHRGIQTWGEGFEAQRGVLSRGMVL